MFVIALIPRADLDACLRRGSHAFCCFALLVWVAANLIVSTQGASIDFTRDVYLVMQRSCFECHGSDRQEAGLRLDDAWELRESGIVEAGDAENSELIRRITLPKNHEEVMPVVGEPLSAAEVAAMTRWINEGAVWPDDFEPPTHWAYVAPLWPNPPEVSNDAWVRNSIDRFVMAKLDSIGWQPSEPADPAVLLRRVHLDLIGLPPTLDEVLEFERDTSDAAYESVVDELMSRRQFGERWARPWLDLARYADSHGFQRDDFRDLWAFRDWVIQAFNDDMPFDQFTIEQLAGDLLPGATASQRVATGFHRCAPTNVEAGSLPEETRTEQVIDRVNTTASVWLGSTLECAQCHDHKYDPFTARDYYNFYAFFNNTQLEAELTNPKKPSSIGFVGPSMNLPNEKRDQQRDALRDQRRQTVTALNQRREELRQQQTVWLGELRQRIANEPKSYPITIRNFASLAKADSHEILDDGSVLLTGAKPPGRDTYEITANVPAQESITALRLDILTDPSLPGSGPGRGNAKRPNFVLHEFEAKQVDADGKSAPLSFTAASADFSQTSYDVAGAIDGDAKTAWAIAPQFFRAHHAIFVLDKPLEAAKDTKLQVTLRQNFGGARTIGRFRLSALTGDTGAETIPANIAKIAAQSPEDWSSKQQSIMLDHQVAMDHTSRSLQKQIDALDQQVKSLAPETTQVMVELDQPRDSFMMQRGDYRSPGDPVQPATPDWLHPLRSIQGPTPNRLDLAHWLVDPNNPLVARVTVNRFWMALFGEGLVRTPEDFGIKGDRPTHPELLDWLALEFVDRGWSIKQLLKTIVLSSTYRQSSALSPEHLASDDQNRTLSRGPRMRLDAEMIRDNALAIAELLSSKSFGPPIKPYQPDGLWRKVGGQRYPYVISPGEDRYRRGVYVVIKRGSPYPSLINFDASSRLACTVQRSRSNTPLQALTLLNDPVYVEATKAVACRAASTAQHQSDRSIIVDEFRRAVARAPDADEIIALENLLADQINTPEASPGQAEQLARDVALPTDVTEQEFGAWYAVAAVLLNLHETITKE